jgi:hypothetical protein
MRDQVIRRREEPTSDTHIEIPVSESEAGGENAIRALCED